MIDGVVDGCLLIDDLLNGSTTVTVDNLVKTVTGKVLDYMPATHQIKVAMEMFGIQASGKIDEVKWAVEVAREQAAGKIEELVKNVTELMKEKDMLRAEEAMQNVMEI